MAAETRRGAQKEWATWKTHTAEFRQKHGIPRYSKPWTTRSDVQLHGIPDIPRVHDLLNACFAFQRRANPSTSTQTLVQDLFVDWSQGVQRKPWSRGCPRTLTTSTCLYSFEKDVVLSGVNMLQLMGWSTQRVLCASHASDHQIKVLAGEAYSLPWCTLLHAILYNNPYGEWWR